MNGRKIFVIVGLILMLGGAFMAMNILAGMKKELPKKPEIEAKRYVKTQSVEYTNLISTVTSTGRVLATNEVLLVAEASGRIEPGNVVLKKGASFKKGDMVLTIYKNEAEMLLKSRKSQFLNIFANMLPDIRVDYPEHYDSFISFFRAIDLNKDLPPLTQDVVSADEKLRIFLAGRNVLSEYYSIRKDEMALKRYSLYAPFNGTFTQVNFEVGAYVNTGTQLAKMISTDNLEVEALVENDQSEWIKIGSKASIISGGRGKEWTGKVVRKSGFVDFNTQSRSIFVNIDQKGRDKVIVGEYLLVRFDGQKIKEAIEIPRNVIFNSNEVFVVIDGRLEKSTVNIIKINERTAIVNGLEPGSELVVEPLINVKEKTVVETIR